MIEEKALEAFNLKRRVMNAVVPVPKVRQQKAGLVGRDYRKRYEE